MTVSSIKNFYVENTITEEEKSFNSLKKAVEYCIKQKNTNLLIHIGGYNLEYYEQGDTYETLYNKCKEILEKI